MRGSTASAVRVWGGGHGQTATAAVQARRGAGTVSGPCATTVRGAGPASLPARDRRALHASLREQPARGGRAHAPGCDRGSRVPRASGARHRARRRPPGRSWQSGAQWCARRSSWKSSQGPRGFRRFRRSRRSFRRLRRSKSFNRCSREAAAGFAWRSRSPSSGASATARCGRWRHPRQRPQGVLGRRRH
jgi:hypothetical protein